MDSDEEGIPIDREGAICDHCAGQGHAYGERCSACKGRGLVRFHGPEKSDPKISRAALDRAIQAVIDFEKRRR